MDETNSMTLPAEPSSDCSLCERLAGFRRNNQTSQPDWFNAPVPSFGSNNAQLLIIGLAPGLKGANKTGRPFTGDHAGDLLYATLLKFGFAQGVYGAHARDGLELANCMITNAVRCVPPQNKPTPAEIRTCRPFLLGRLDRLSNVRILLALGRIAHDSILTALELRKSSYPFGHANAHRLSGTLTLFDSYHCSRYNTNTGRLTEAMFEDVFDAIKSHLNAAR